MHRVRILTIVFLSVSLLTFLGMGQNQYIKIGVVSPHSPPGSLAQGSEGRKGLKIAAELLNEQGGVLGKKIKLQFCDSRGVPEDGRSCAERLITKEKVDLLTGGIHSSVCMAMSEVAHSRGVPFMNVNCWADAIREKGYEEWWNTSVNNSRMAVAGAEMIKNLEAKTVVAFAENTDFGIGLAKKLQKQLKKKAPGVHSRYKIVDREAKDYTPAISPLVNNPPDVVVTIMDPPGGYIMINQLYEQGIAPTSDTSLLDLDALAALPGFWDNVEEGGKYMIGLVLFHPNMYLTPLGQEVRERYMEREGKEPSRLVFQGFDALWTLANAAMRAGTTATDSMINVLKKTWLPGSRGVITFNLEKGPFFQQWVEVPYAMIQFREVNQPVGEAPIVFPEKQATAELVKPE